LSFVKLQSVNKTTPQLDEAPWFYLVMELF